MPTFRSQRRRWTNSGGGQQNSALTQLNYRWWDTTNCIQLSSCAGMTNFVNQAMFFLLCDRLFCPQEKLTGLYTLLFYNVISYMWHYAKETLFSMSSYSPIVRISEHANVGHLAMTATKIVLDLTKAISFVITGVFMLLVFGLPSQGHFNPTWCYLIITAFYYCLTESNRAESDQNMVELLTYFQFEIFENLEILWTPVLLRLMTSFASGLVITLVWLFTPSSSWFLIMVSSYVNVYLCLKEMDQYWKILITERRSLDKYRFATVEELSEKCADDVCAVCLADMSQKARVTPCRHYFHSDCLRRCLQQNTDPLCPICKQPI